MSPKLGATRMRRRPVPSSGSGVPVDGVCRALLGLAFALFDREAGHRGKVVAGLGALLLMGATHVALTGPWVREAGQAMGLPQPLAQPGSRGR